MSLESSNYHNVLPDKYCGNCISHYNPHDDEDRCRGVDMCQYHKCEVSYYGVCDRYRKEYICQETIQ